MFLLDFGRHPVSGFMVCDAAQEYARIEVFRAAHSLFLLCFLQKIRKGQQKYFSDDEEGKTGK